MKYTGIIFDLFGTLTGDLTEPQYTDVLTNIASVLPIPTDDFYRLWSTTHLARNTGKFESISVLLVHICRELGIQYSDDANKKTAQIRRDYARLIMTSPRKDDKHEVVKAVRLRDKITCSVSHFVNFFWPKWLN